MRRGPILSWLVVLTALALVGYFGSRWVLWQLYPLHYREPLFRYAQENSLDPYLVAAVIRVESRFRPRVTSPRGARGLMQVMPETGRWVAGQMRVPFDPEMLYDPEYNIRLGCWYLASLHREFDGRIVPALAAYNGGRNNVRKWLETGRWDGSAATLARIPYQETRLYVARVLRDLERYQRIYGR